MRKKADSFFLANLGALVILGLIILTSVSVVISQKKFENSYYYIWHQVLYGFLPGLFGFILLQKIHYRKLRKLAIPMLIVSIFLLLLVFKSGIGLSFGGAKRWISLYGYSFQPSELLKLTFVIYLAAWFEGRRKSIRGFFSGLLPFWFITGAISVFLILQPDIGTLGIILFTALAMYALAGGRLAHIILTIFMGFLILILIVEIAPYRMNRIITFFSPELDKLGMSYQINQALVGIGSGGFFGLGLGQSRLKYEFLPEAMGDSIFAVAAEELGFIGSIVIVLLFFFLVWRIFVIAKNSYDKFGTLLAFGIGIWIGSQAFVNIAAISGLIPLTGIPLPFVSYGSSALLINLLAAGLVANISRHN